MRVATFNVQNLRLRGWGSSQFLDGARDGDLSDDLGPSAMEFDRVDRMLTAEVLREANADVVALQEVFDRSSLDFFHDQVLSDGNVPSYPNRICMPGNDGRGLDVAIMSRRPIDFFASHAAATPASLGLEAIDSVGPNDRIFRRDCLEVRIGRLNFVVCHFKAPYPNPDVAWSVRRLEAKAVRSLIERRFSDPHKSLWLVLGDLNEPGQTDPDRERAITPILGSFSADLLERMPAAERWSYFQPKPPIYSRPDALLASRALATGWPQAVPRVLRRGLGREAERYHGPRLTGVGQHRPHASDHAALVVDFAGL